MNRLTNVRGYVYPAQFASLPHFYDSSYGNDVTDSIVFSVGTHAVTLWIDDIDPKERHRDHGWDPDQPVSDENQPPHRFIVMPLDDAEPGRVPAPTLQNLCEERHLEDCVSILETDDPDAVLAFIFGGECERVLDAQKAAKS